MSTKFVRLELSENMLHLPKHGYMILNCMAQTREKLRCGAATFWLDLNFEWYEDTMVFRMFIFVFFCLEPTLRKDTWMRVIFSKVLLRKLLDHIYVQCFFSRIARQFENSTLKEILQLKILWTWIKIRVNTFIKTLVNIMKQKSTKVLWKLSFTKKHDPALQRTLHQSGLYFTYCYTLLFL